MGSGSRRSRCRTARRRSSIGSTQAEAIAKRQAGRKQVEQGRDPHAKATTVGAYLTRWLTDLEARDLAPKTLDQYQRLTRLHIIPVLGTMKLDRLTAADVNRWLRDRQKGDDATKRKPLSAKTCSLLRGTLRAALNVAERDGLIARNPVIHSEPPKGEGRAIAPLSLTDMERFKITVSGDPYECLYRLMLDTGLRIGEALALRWENVDLDGVSAWSGGAPALRVEWTLQRAPVTPGTANPTELVLRRPKTLKSRRLVPIWPELVPALRAHHKAQIRRRTDKLDKGQVWADSGLVFVTDFGAAIDPRNALRRFHDACETAGLDRHRLHDLRHSAATSMLADGVPVKVVSDFLGHAQMSTTTDTYGHVSWEAMIAAVNRIRRQAPTASEPVAIGAKTGTDGR